MMKFEGVMPALVTPLNEDESVNVSTVHKLIKDLLAQGADGFYVGGATGEGIALGKEAREVLIEEAVKAAGDKPCIAHIASANFNEAVELAKHAEKAGAKGISAIPPLFFKYDENDVYNYYKKLAESTNLPLMIYYNPAAGFTVNAEFAAKCFEIDNVTAIKWTSPDYFGMLHLKTITNGEMNIINGPDEMLLMGLSAGADGGIGTTYNFMFPIIRRVYDNFRKGNIDEARKAQSEADRIIRVLLGGYKTIPATKVILEKMGYDVGNCVYPMKRYTAEEKEKIIADFRKAGLNV